MGKHTLKSLKEALKEVELMQEGKIKKKTWEELLKELKDMKGETELCDFGT